MMRIRLAILSALSVFVGWAVIALSDEIHAENAETTPELAPASALDFREAIDAIRSELTVLTQEELLERLEKVNAQMMERAAELEPIRAELRDARDQARLTDDGVEAIWAEIRVLRQKIEEVIDQIPSIKEVLEDVAARERELLQLMHERTLIHNRLSELEEVVSSDASRVSSGPAGSPGSE